MNRNFTLDNNDLPGKKAKQSEKSGIIAPSQWAVSNVLSYSRALMVIKTKLSGNINLILN